MSHLLEFFGHYLPVLQSYKGDGLQASERMKSDGKLKLWYEIGLSGDEIKIIKHRTITLSLHLRLNSILHRDYIVFIGFLRPPGSNSG